MIVIDAINTGTHDFLVTRTEPTSEESVKNCIQIALCGCELLYAVPKLSAIH